MSRRQTLAERRRILVARSDAHRAALADAMDGLARRTAPVDSLLTAARGIHRHRLLFGAATAGFLLAPAAARAWVRRVVWVMPMIMDGYRLARSARSIWRARPH